MKKTILLAFLLVTSSHAQDTAPATDEGRLGATRMLRLASGDVLWGAIGAHDEEQLEFHRVDTGGLVLLPWSFLDPAQSEELRTAFGYVDIASEELMMDAERLALRDGTDYVGVIVERDDEFVWVKRAEGTIPIPLTGLAGTSTLVRVPALELFTKEELYQRKLMELQSALLAPGTVAAKANDELAQYSEKLFDYQAANHHYRDAATADPGYDPERIQASIARTAEKAELQEQIDVLAEVDLLRARKRYDLAFERLNEFPEMFPSSPLTEDFAKMRARVEKHQLRDVKEEIVRLVNRRAVDLTHALARKRQGYDETVGYLEEGLVEELWKSVQEGLQRLAPDISVEDVQRQWNLRERGKIRLASYGLGTWLLGEGRALTTYDDEEEEEEAPEVGSQAEAKKKLSERIERYLRNQELTRKAKSGGGAQGEGDPALFWEDWNLSGRRQWLLAYFAEFSGLFKVERVRFTNCRECGGSGARDVLYTGSAIAGDSSRNVLVPCPACHTIGVVRRIGYR